MVSRLEHSHLVLAGEASPGADPEEPADLGAAEADLAAYGSVRPVAELPDDPDQVGQYIETVHLRLARVGRALAHNQRLREETDPDPGAAVAARTALAVERYADEEPTGVSDRVGADGPAGAFRSGTEDVFGTGDNSGGGDGPSPDEPETDASGETAATESEGAAGGVSPEAVDDSAAGGADDTTVETPDDPVVEDDTTVEGEEDSAVEGADDATVEGRDDSAVEDENDTTVDDEDSQSAEAAEDSTVDGDPTVDASGDTDAGHRPTQVIPAESDPGREDGTVDVDPAETESSGDGITRRQALFGGSIAAALAAAAGGAAAVLWTGDGDTGEDGETGTGEENTGAGGDDTDSTSDGDAGETGDESPADGSGDEPADASGDGAFELADRDVTADPDEEYVELRYTGESEQDLSGYRLYDSADGQADPEETGTLDPFVFPDGTVLSSDETVRVYTGEGEAGDGVFYWGYGVNIWREDGDTVVLADPDGTVVFETGYGPAG